MLLAVQLCLLGCAKAATELNTKGPACSIDDPIGAYGCYATMFGLSWSYPTEWRAMHKSEDLVYDLVGEVYRIRSAAKASNKHREGSLLLESIALLSIRQVLANISGPDDGTMLDNVAGMYSVIALAITTSDELAMHAEQDEMSVQVRQDRREALKSLSESVGAGLSGGSDDHDWTEMTEERWKTVYSSLEWRRAIGEIHDLNVVIKAVAYFGYREAGGTSRNR